MLTALVTVVGVATVTHLIVRFYIHRSEGLPPREAFARGATLLAWPILGACLTDAVGFGSLWWSSVGPVFDFGTMMVVGSLLVAPATLMLAPALALAGQPEKEAPPSAERGSLARGLSGLMRVVERRQKMVLAAAALITLFALLGAVQITVETDFTRNFRRGSELVRSYEVIESRLGGAGVWDVLIPAPHRLDQEYIDRVIALEERLREIRLTEPATVEQPPRRALTKVLSLADAVEAAKADRRFAFMPPELRARGMGTAMPNFTRALRNVDDDGQPWLRIMLRSRERLPAEWKKQVLDDVHRAVREAFPGEGKEPPGEVTGYHVLMTTLVESLVRDQWTMFALACAGIAGMMLIAFRSMKLALLCLVPNILPVLLVMGLIGWLGIRLNMGAAMIAAVSMGLSVDSSIHYIAGFRRARGRGLKVYDSVREVQQSVGKAMVVATLAIVVGFSVLCTSEFIPTVYFGALASLTMLGGLAGNLILLPLLLLWAGD
jgi:uncharacterized protein